MPLLLTPCLVQVHGSAPDIAGQDKANPLAMVLSAAMMCRYGLNLPKVGGWGRPGGSVRSGAAGGRHNGAEMGQKSCAAHRDMLQGFVDYLGGGSSAGWST